jgi:hypothetical protein
MNIIPGMITRHSLNMSWNMAAYTSINLLGEIWLLNRLVSSSLDRITELNFLSSSLNLFRIFWYCRNRKLYSTVHKMDSWRQWQKYIYFSQLWKLKLFRKQFVSYWTYRLEEVWGRHINSFGLKTQPLPPFPPKILFNYELHHQPAVRELPVIQSALQSRNLTTKSSIARGVQFQWSLTLLINIVQTGTIWNLYRNRSYWREFCV